MIAAYNAYAVGHTVVMVFLIVMIVAYPLLYFLLRWGQRRLQAMVAPAQDDTELSDRQASDPNTYQTKVLYQYAPTWFSVPIPRPATLRLSKGKLSLVVDGDRLENTGTSIFDIALGEIRLVKVDDSGILLKTKGKRYRLWLKFIPSSGSRGGLGLLQTVMTYEIPNADQLIAGWYQAFTASLPSGIVHTGVGFWPDQHNDMAGTDRQASRWK